MLVLVTYDVETLTPDGRRRLRRVARLCTKFGQRVQNSVFECVLDSTQFALLKNDLLSVIDKDKDSVRFYFTKDKRNRKVEHIGLETSFDVEGDLFV